jgi:hypothetical protein
MDASAGDPAWRATLLLPPLCSMQERSDPVGREPMQDFGSSLGPLARTCSAATALPVTGSPTRKSLMSTYPPDDSTPIYDRSAPAVPAYDDPISADRTLTPAATFDTSDASTTSGKTDAAKSAASDVADDAKGAAADVAGTTKEQAKRVASEATDHAKDLYNQASAGLKEQAGQQQERAAGGLRSLSEQLGSMADNSDEDGVAQKVVRDLAQRAGSAAGFLENRDPGSLLDEVKSFAARRPGTFIALAAGAGILAGRLTKALAADAKHEHDQTASTTDTTPSGDVIPGVGA